MGRSPYQSSVFSSLIQKLIFLKQTVFEYRGKKPQVPPLRSPEFPVETRGFDDLHAALSTESRTPGRR